MTNTKEIGKTIELSPEWVAKNRSTLKDQPVGLYGRISGRKSLDGSSLESQIAVNRRFAISCGAKVVAERMEIVTGVFITARSEFNALLEMGQRGEIRFIIVDVRDRLGRGEAIAVLEFLARQAGVGIIYATQPADLETYEGVALDATETLVSRIERLNIRRRTNRGRRERSSEGRIFTGRFFPYGYRNKVIRDDKGRLVERTLVIYEPEARIVRLIFRWFVYDDLTTYAIAGRLEKQGVPVPEGHRSNRKCTPNHWHLSTIERILKNETYAGLWHYGKRAVSKYEDGTKIRYKVGNHDPEHWIAIEVPPIVNRDIWSAAQDVMTRHSRGGSTPKYQYLLRGMLRCTKSNANMTGQTVRHKETPYGYYVCPHRGPLLRLDPATRCDVHQLPQRKLEQWVWSTLMDLAQNPDRIKQEIEFRREQAESDNRLVRQAIIGTEQEIVRLKRQKTDLLDLYLNRDKAEASVTREEYETKARQIVAEVSRMETEVKEMQARFERHIVTPEQSDEALKLLEKVRLAGPHATFEERRAILHLLAIQILYNGEQVQIAGSVPPSSATLDQILRNKATGDSFSPRPQSELSVDFPQVEEDNSILSDHKRNTDCTRN